MCAFFKECSAVVVIKEKQIAQQIAVIRESEKKKKLEKNRGTRVTETERER